ncbi:dihydrofolate reductase [Halostagnicola larsenii XH-48]|uniref:dihydrofolate reductase n=1 Tax=Halostagnicola larsenii XH-48 TaxID=797299 RepID=W0JQX3_9EURY|nr:dihydrofolate reductase [Halostagnicola larsenii]AHF99367.1 dihydrofolate reductase [Halostagnicola larsenii XH-48]
MSGGDERTGADDAGPNEVDVTDAEALETDCELVAIVAVADNGIIGRDGDMPWHIPADLEHFKETTIDHPVIMGRVTYEGILEALGEPLPGRTTVVLTSQDLETPENAVTAAGIEGALEAAETAARDRHDDADRIFVAGGATVYEQFLPVVDRLIVTEVHEEPAGDTSFPAWDREAWNERARDERDGFAFVEYGRRRME